MKASDVLVVALDVGYRDDALRYLDHIGEGVGWVKVGLELFDAEGPTIVRDLRSRGLKVFLDLKLHDIPNTVKRSLFALGNLAPDLVNIHALGGRAMIEAAAQALRGAPTGLLAVTILTSHDESSLREIGIEGPLEAAVLRLASLAHRSGAGGVVASGGEAAAIRRAEGPDFTILVPGVRSERDARDDQRRTISIREALRAGADHVVIGRTLSLHDNVKGRFEELRHETEAAIRELEG